MSESQQTAQTPSSAAPTVSKQKSPEVAVPEVATHPTTPEPPDIVPVLPPEHWANQDGGENDSAVDDGYAGSTGGLESSILKYRTLHGRRFHSKIGDAQYWASNDERQTESLDLLHHIFSLVLEGELFLAPIREPRNVLDIGTGTGIWAMDFADKFPECEVTGTDISPIQPTWVPPNLRFEIEDCTGKWTFPPNSLDFVHIRYLLGSVSDWTAFFKEAYSALEPGGYLESYEASPRVYSDDDTLPPTSATAQWTSLFIDSGRKIGRSFDIVEDNTQNKAMEEAGFVDIEERWVKIPVGTWPKDPSLKRIGAIAAYAVERDIEGFIVFVTSVQGWTREEVIVYSAHLRRELRSMKYHVWYWQKVVWGRKPKVS